jgi:hypothetical protein
MRRCFGGEWSAQPQIATASVFNMRGRMAFGFTIEIVTAQKYMDRRAGKHETRSARPLPTLDIRRRTANAHNRLARICV